MPKAQLEKDRSAAGAPAQTSLAGKDAVEEGCLLCCQRIPKLIEVDKCIPVSFPRSLSSSLFLCHSFSILLFFILTPPLFLLHSSLSLHPSVSLLSPVSLSLHPFFSLFKALSNWRRPSAYLPLSWSTNWRRATLSCRNRSKRSFRPFSRSCKQIAPLHQITRRRWRLRLQRRPSCTNSTQKPGGRRRLRF